MVKVIKHLYFHLANAMLFIAYSELSTTFTLRFRWTFKASSYYCFKGHSLSFTLWLLPFIIGDCLFLGSSSSPPHPVTFNLHHSYFRNMYRNLVWKRALESRRIHRVWKVSLSSRWLPGTHYKGIIDFLFRFYC